MMVFDFEASSLNYSTSYPIQVAVINEAGETYSSYIRPQETWTDWSFESQQIHNIPRQLLFDVGVDPTIVAQQLNDFIGSNTAFCDGGDYDSMWLRRLYLSTSVVLEWTAGDVIKHALWGQYRSCPVVWWQYKQQIANELSLTEHDALNDVRIIQRAALDIKNRVV